MTRRLHELPGGVDVGLVDGVHPVDFEAQRSACQNSVMTPATYYHATLCLHAPLIVTKDEKRGGIKVAIDPGGRQIPVGVKRRLAALLQEKPPEGEQGIIVWPRTDKEGLLGNGTQLALYKGVGELKPRTGRLVVTKAQAVPLPPKRVVTALAK